MIWNYLKTIFRNIRIHKGYSLLHISGLSVGAAVFLFVILFIQYELGYDRHNENIDRIYRLECRLELNEGNEQMQAVSPMPAAHAFEKEYDEIEKAVRIAPAVFNIKEGDDIIRSQGIYGDPGFEHVFSLNFLSKPLNGGLYNQGHIWISSKLAEKLNIGTENTGQIIRLNTDEEYMVAGIFKDIGRQSHFDFDFIVPFQHYEYKLPRELSSHWSTSIIYSYLLLKDGAKAEVLEGKIEGKVAENSGLKNKFFYLKPLKDIYLFSHAAGEIKENGDPDLLQMLSLIAFTILLIACINYINLNTAFSAGRIKEVIIRKLSGSSRGMLRRQFMLESTVTAAISILAGIGLIELTLPYFNELMGTEIISADMGKWPFLLGIGGTLILMSILAGMYPSFYLARLEAGDLLHGHKKRGSYQKSVRRMLVVAQFIVSIVLVIATFNVYRQIEYLKKKDMGFDSEKLMVLDLQKNPADSLVTASAFKNKIKDLPGVRAAAYGHSLPFFMMNSTSVRWDGNEEGEKELLRYFYGDEDFLDLLGIEIISADTAKYLKEETASICLINEAAKETFGWESVKGKHFHYTYEEHEEIDGLMRNFHFESLRHRIMPCAYYQIKGDQFHKKMLIRLKNEPDEYIRSNILEITRSSFPKSLPNLSVLDDQIDSLLRKDRQFAGILSFFSILAMFIALTGLYGLLAFSNNQRRKEIGIRKTLGADSGNILSILLKDMIRPIAISVIIAWPVAGISIWTYFNRFAFQAGFSVVSVLTATMLALLVAFITIFTVSWFSARQNPAKIIRYE